MTTQNKFILKIASYDSVIDKLETKLFIHVPKSLIEQIRECCEPINNTIKKNYDDYIKHNKCDPREIKRQAELIQIISSSLSSLSKSSIYIPLDIIKLFVSFLFPREGIIMDFSFLCEPYALIEEITSIEEINTLNSCIEMNFKIMKLYDNRLDEHKDDDIHEIRLRPNENINISTIDETKLHNLIILNVNKWLKCILNVCNSSLIKQDKLCQFYRFPAMGESIVSKCGMINFFDQNPYLKNVKNGDIFNIDYNSGNTRPGDGSNIKPGDGGNTRPGDSSSVGIGKSNISSVKEDKNNETDIVSKNKEKLERLDNGFYCYYNGDFIRCYSEYKDIYLPIMAFEIFGQYECISFFNVKNSWLMHILLSKDIVEELRTTENNKKITNQKVVIVPNDEYPSDHIYEIIKYKARTYTLKFDSKADKYYNEQLDITMNKSNY